MVGRTVARRAIGTAAGVILLVATAGPLRAAHPLHTSLAELVYSPSTRMVRVSLRLFADDFSSAVTRGTAAAPGARVVVPPDTAAFRYVTRRFTLFDRAGRVVPLRWCGMRRVGEQLFVCLRGAISTPPAGGRIRNTLLSEIFTDQVNIVQASYGGRRRTLLFTSAAAKALR